MERLFRYIDANKGVFLNELKEFLSIPSISAQSDHNADIRMCAKWIADQMCSIGMHSVQIFETSGHPVVYCEWMGAPDSPTVLFYGHYDVQPVEPLNLWTSPPFEATIRGKDIYARGSVDDKGQVLIQLKSIEAYMKNFGNLPLNIKMLIEGEEEIGSVNLKEFLNEHKDLLKADFALISDTSMFKDGIPSVCYGLRGLALMEMEVTGPASDLHSGSFGGSIHNPIQALCEIIAALHDKNGRVTIPGFYEDVLPINDREREELKDLPHNDKIFAEELGVKKLYGEKGFSTLERLWVRPTLECNGIWGGYTGEGAKTVLPSKAYAKMSMRLVPNQEPVKMATLFLEYIKQIAPGTINLEIRFFAGSESVITSKDSPWIRAVVSALEKGFGSKPVYQREGGSIPVVAQLKNILNLDPVLVGFGLPDANAHAPDEHLNLDNFFGGIRTLVYFFNEFQS
ncbi:MAG: dipeptidase [bacterium]